MSKIAKEPISIPKGVELLVNTADISVKGSKGNLSTTMPEGLNLKVEEDTASVVYPENLRTQAGTFRANLSNMVKGVSDGFEKKLELVGVGYRAQAQGNKLNLTLGFSHPVDYSVPEGITITTPSQTEIIVAGFDKQKVGQVASEIRAFRPPEPYKGKGVRYSNERVIRKEAKKK